MCRWLAYSGTPLLLDALLYKPAHSLIDQSLHSPLGVETTNGDGFGVGWYGRWMWMHNGAIADFHLLRRDLCMLVDPALFAHIEGTTDSEVMFYLAVTLGLGRDPPGAVARMVGVVERSGRERGVEFPMQMTVAVTDGERVWALRYSSQGASRSLFYSSRVEALRKLHPDVAYLQNLSEQTRLIVSEPLSDLPGAWNEVPESSYGVVQPGADEMFRFAPEPA
ncbi:class II glutamine amidotransferase [Streptomyces cirratus]|uniref:Class II glutamine amidotransferase n=1 Tax=Streptomyces cirratus TaxID=68187 RepID=A0ABQ3EVN5_9ACTN|nr:class II glutamine amidotransferase [Streptomyces cirratus]GHB53586.1 class II glutamine amidotransferase [Streptomyces cirratus]